MGVLPKALTLECTIDDGKDVFSHLWGLDKGDIAGSAGRVLTSVGITKIVDITDKQLEKLKGKTFKVKNKNDKLYWY